MSNPNFINKWTHGKTKVMRIPECFEEITLYVVDKLDKNLIDDIELEKLIETRINQWKEHLIYGTIDGKKVNFLRQDNIDIDNLLSQLNDSQKLTLLKKLLKE